MDFKDCIKFANENSNCSLATVDGNQPRVRIINMWFADETGFYFQSQSVKAMCKQLKKNKNVEACFYNPKAIPGMMRVTGEVEFVDDMALRKRCLEERGFLKALGIVKPEDPMLAVFRIARGEAHFWTRADSMKEAQIPRIKFGR